MQKLSEYFNLHLWPRFSTSHPVVVKSNNLLLFFLFFSGKKQVINPPVRQLFQPSTSGETHVKDLVNVFYPTVPDAAVMDYIDISSPVMEYPPAADFNVATEIEIEAEVVTPPSIIQLAAECKNTEELLHKLSSFQKEDIDALELKTRGQSENTDWKCQRAGRITASTIHRVHTKVKSLQKKPDDTSVESLVNSITHKSVPSADIPALKYGRQMEEEALHAYVQELKRQGHKDVKVTRCGLFVLPNKAYIGATPDALVSCSCCGKGLAELKAPFSIANQSPKEGKLTYLKMDEHQNLKLVQNDKYFSQVQTQMGVTGRKWDDFFVYTRHGFFLERILFQPNRWQELLQTAEYFFVHHVAPELLA